MPELHPLMTTREVADAMRVTRQTIGAWVDAGKIPVVILPNGYRRFRREDVDALLAVRAAS